MRLIQSGPRNAPVMLVGEAPGEHEDRIGLPFVGISGHELDQQLGQAGLQRSQMFLTNVVHERPPGNDIALFFGKSSELRKHNREEMTLINANAAAVLAESFLAVLKGRICREPVIRGLFQLQRNIDEIRPRLIIALGNTAMWALTGETGITRWRGSQMSASGGPVDGHGIPLIPTMHPAAVTREPVWRAVAIADLKRAKREFDKPSSPPAWRYTIPTTVADVHQWLDAHVFNGSTTPIAADIENVIGNGSLICLGLASSPLDAICIPFMHRVGLGEDAHYWPDPADELEVVKLCRQALRARPIIFHNGLHDCQIIARSWGLLPYFSHDTMVMQHVAFPGMMGGKINPVTGQADKKGASLSLSFIASLYCHNYRFWKNDGRGWDPEIHSEDQYWRYNCEDCCRTFECFEELSSILHRENLWEQYLFEMELFEPVFAQMFRGIRFDDERRREMRREVEQKRREIQAWINAAVGHELNVGSAKQMMQLFYDDLQLPRALNRKTHQPTLDDKALDGLKKKKPVLRPLIERIQAMRSLDTLEENFLGVKIDADGRIRSALNIAGVETMRFSSNINAFGTGWNAQNTPRPPED